VTKKKCPKCGKKLPATLKYFSPHRRPKDSLKSWCKACMSVSSAAWRASNSEKHRANVAKWRAANPLHGTWQQMLYRCTSRKHDSWKFYGAIGVRVCSRWSDPEQGYKNFVADMGPNKPTPQHSLSRFGDVGTYEPGNVKWMTWAEQGVEKRKKWKLQMQQAA
jgi:hypothetical protein